MFAISIKDRCDTFTATDQGLILECPASESLVTVESRSPFGSFLMMVAQMYFDHEDHFSEVDPELVAKYGRLFHEMYDASVLNK